MSTVSTLASASAAPPSFVLGHVHLKVRDLPRAVAFYTQIFGLTVEEQVGHQYAFLTDGLVHHIVALQSVGPGAPLAPPQAVGLYHTAFEVPDKQALARVYHALQKQGIEIIAVDHGISWAIYFDDPDGNGLEIYADTRAIATRTEWEGQSRRPSTKDFALTGADAL